jgi:folate-binding protein YgfZ
MKPMPFSLDRYRAARQSACVFDRSGRARIVLHGRDRLTFLHALLTNDVAALKPGSGCYAALLTPQGRMIADMRLFDLGDITLLDVHPETKDTLLAKLDQMLFSEDVQFGDVTDTFGCLSVQGPLAPGVAASVLGTDAADLAAWPPFRNARVGWRGETVIAARVDEFGVPGVFLFAAAGIVPALAAEAEARGAPMADADTAEVLRIEAGVPAFLVDMNAETIPLEAGLESTAISYTKGCFPGQEVLVRIRDRGHGRVAKRLVGFVIEGDAVPGAGDVVRAAEKDVGAVTSGVFSPALGRPIALGYVQRDVAEPGTAVSVVHDGTALAGAVSALPFALP